jgi:trimethylamine--corrinoid protein Co-methyltransferase
MRGIEITPETLALDTIHKVGPRGGYLEAEHTARHYREVWYPRILDRSAHHNWEEAGSQDSTTTARRIARETILNHTPQPLPESAIETARGLIQTAENRL